MSTHVIRLGAAWQVESGTSTRRFNRPTGIESGVKVWLAWDGPAENAELNGKLLDEHYQCGPPRFEVTERLEPSNLLSMGTDNGAVLATVRLEIEEIAADSWGDQSRC